MRSLLLRKKKFFFIGGIIALLVVAGVALVNKLQPQEASASSNKNVNLVINGSSATSYFSIDGRYAWCITPSKGDPSSGSHSATVYNLSDFQNATSGEKLYIKRMFTAYYYASLNVNSDPIHSITNNDAMHWALAYLYSGNTEYPADGVNAKTIFDYYKKAFPDNLEWATVTIIPYTGDKSSSAGTQAIFTADYKEKTTENQNVTIKKVWKDGLEAADHPVTIKYKLMDASTGAVVKNGTLNNSNNWTDYYSEEVEAGTTRTFKVEEIIENGQDGFEIVSPEGEDRWHNTAIDQANNGEIIYYFMPHEISCGSSSNHLTNTCTMINRAADVTKVNFWTTKHWSDSGYADDYRPESVNYTVHAFIYRNGIYEMIDDFVDKAGVTFVKRGSGTSTEWGGYVAGLVTKYNVDGIDYDIVYAIEESNVPKGYTMSCDDDTITVGSKTYCKASQNDEGDYAVEWTNSITKITVAAKKHWNDGGNVDKRPSAVAFQIYRSVNGGNMEYYRTTYMVKSWYGTRDDWSLSISLAKTDKDGNEYNYSYKEIDYYNRNTKTYVSDDYIIDGQLIGFNTGNNTGSVNTAKTSIPVKKCFVDKDETKRPEELDFELFAGDDFVENLTLTSANENEESGCWEGEFDNLPAYDDDGNEITYHVEEDTSTMEGYELDEEFSTCEVKAGENFAADDENKASCTFYNVELVDIPVIKVWEEDSKEDRPGSIEVSLLCGDDVLDTVTLSEENNLDGDNTWEYTWKNRRVDECEQGYSVAENINIPGYKTKITGNAEDGFVITNTKTLDEILTWGSLGAGSFGAIAAGFFLVKRKLFDR